MRAECYIYAPHGPALRKMFAKLFNDVRDSNRLWINAMANAHPGVRRDRVLPRCSKVAGIRYQPPQGVEKETDHQGLYAAPYMFQRGHGSCGDIAAYDAACLMELYGVGAVCQIVSQDGTSYHANVMTDFGVYDPTAPGNWTDPAYILPPLEDPAKTREAVLRLCSV